MITQRELKALFTYDPETGLFYSARKTSKKEIGQVVQGSRGKEGYFYIAIKRKRYKAHRLAFLYMTGFIPKIVDHDNNDTFDNRWANLRSATDVENARNASKRKDNTSGYKGVCWHKQTGWWRARISYRDRRVHLGSFATAEEAHEAYKKAAAELHEDFANVG